MKKQLLSFLAICGFAASAMAQTPCSDLFISEYVEGDVNNRALEIYNPTPNAINLANYSVGRYANGNATGMFSDLSGTIAPYETFVVVLDKRDQNGTGVEEPIWAALEAAGDMFLNPVYVASNSPMYFNGNDAVALRKLGVVIDVIGVIGVDPGFDGWLDFATGTWSTTNQTLVRDASIQAGDANGYDSFYPDFEWDNYPANTFTNLGTHTSVCYNPPCTTSGNVQLSGLNTSYTISDGAVTLTGSPAGGVFFGSAVSGNQFDPASAGIGTHSVIYTYVDGNGCVGSDAMCTTVDQTVDISNPTNIGSDNGLDVYPNPSTGSFNLTLDDANGIVNYTIFDARGREVGYDSFVATGGAVNKTINLNQKADGVYTIQVVTPTGTVSQKLIKE